MWENFRRWLNETQYLTIFHISHYNLELKLTYFVKCHSGPDSYSTTVKNQHFLTFIIYLIVEGWKFCLVYTISDLSQMVCKNFFSETGFDKHVLPTVLNKWAWNRAKIFRNARNKQNFTRNWSSVWKKYVYINILIRLHGIFAGKSLQVVKITVPCAQGCYAFVNSYHWGTL